MVTVFISYKLKEGVNREEYRRWSREIDQPAASTQPGVLTYEIYEIEGGEGEPPYDVIEVIGAESWEAWQRVPRSPEMQPVIEGFLELADPESLQIVYGREI